jgi:hypothetical protein
LSGIRLVQDGERLIQPRQLARLGRRFRLHPRQFRGRAIPLRAGGLKTTAAIKAPAATAAHTGDQFNSGPVWPPAMASTRLRSRAGGSTAGRAGADQGGQLARAPHARHAGGAIPLQVRADLAPLGLFRDAQRV